MIIVAGSINLDLIARVPRLPLPGETISGSSFSQAPGGKGANQALAARRAGQSVAMLGAVGQDTNGAPALALLEDAGVDLTNMHRSADLPTGVALILVDDKTGENEIVVVAGANTDAQKAFGAFDDLSREDIVCLQMEIPVEANEEALAACAKTGARALLNTAPFSPQAARLSMRAHITTANETEFDLLADAMALGAGDRIAKAQAFVEATGKTIIITLGADGAFCAGPDGQFTVASPKIVSVDTVGAGDTFCGYLAAGLADAMSLESAIARACAAGALACLKQGAQPAIPTREQVDAFTRAQAAW